jgi:hypothetical protein
MKVSVNVMQSVSGWTATNARYSGLHRSDRHEKANSMSLLGENESKMRRTGGDSIKA